MIRKIAFTSLILWSFLMPGFALAVPRTIHVELSYSGLAASYNLYQDGGLVCTSNNPSLNTMDCNVEIGTAPMTFVLTAVDVNGVESPPSAPYVLTPPAQNPVTGNYIPQADFTTSGTTGQAPFHVSFDASASSDFDGLISSYEWNFGDGNTATGELADHTFTSPATYTVLLTVYDTQGESAVKSVDIVVSSAPATPNQKPTASFSAIQLVQGVSRLQFDASASSDSDGTIASYAWNFGDGETLTGKVVEHEFQATGNYTVVLTVTDNLGATATDQMIITVVDPPTPVNTPPVAAISASTAKRNLHFEWDYTGTDPGLVGFRLYQNSRLVCEVANPAARQADCLDYIDNGQVRLWVTAYDQSGVESAPSSVLTFDSTGLFDATGGDAPVTVHFSGGTSSDSDGTIASYVWNFGDGSVADGVVAEHLFSLPGNYNVTLTVIDNSGAASTSAITIAVLDRQPPVAVNATLTTAQDKPVTATLSANDPEGSPLSFRITQDGTLGTATITDPGKGVFTYVPKTGVFGSDSFKFKANDGTSDSNEAVVSITIAKTNLAPIATAASLAVVEDTASSSVLQASDPNKDPLTFSIVTSPAHGVVTMLNASTGAFSYKPAANYNGSDSFTFKVSDGAMSSNVATVNLTVSPVNDAPIATGKAITVAEDTAISGVLPASDVDKDALTFSVVTKPTHGTVTLVNASTGAFSYKPAANYYGADSFTFKASDGKLSSNVATISLTITPVNDAPKAVSDAATVKKGLSVSIPVLANDSDVDKDVLKVVSLTAPRYGKAVIVNGTTVTYTANTTFAGKVSFNYSISDGKGGTATGTITVTVQ